MGELALSEADFALAVECLEVVLAADANAEVRHALVKAFVGCVIRSGDLHDHVLQCR